MSSASSKVIVCNEDGFKYINQDELEVYLDRGYIRGRKFNRDTMRSDEMSDDERVSKVKTELSALAAEKDELVKQITFLKKIYKNCRNKEDDCATQLELLVNMFQSLMNAQTWIEWNSWHVDRQDIVDNMKKVSIQSAMLSERINRVIGFQLEV